MTVIVGIPTLSRYDLLPKAIESVLSGTQVPDRIIVVDNGGKFHSEYKGPKNRVEVITPGKNLGCAGGWNAVLREAKDDDIVCLINDDLEMRRNGIQKLIVNVEESKAPQALVLGGPKPWHTWSAFAMRKNLVKVAGWFDEGFWPAYYEDNDYAYRLKLLGIPTTWAESVGLHVGSASTFEHVKTTKEDARESFDKCKRRYCAKWGGLPGAEKFSTAVEVAATYDMPQPLAAGEAASKGQELDKLALKYGTDKASLRHNYTKAYQEQLLPFRDKIRSLLEIGVLGGASLRMWKEWLPNAQVVGIDIDPTCAFQEDRISVVTGMQQDSDTVEKALIASGCKLLDIVIDDGGHVGIEQIQTFELLWKHVMPGGCYIIEDLHTSYWEAWGGDLGGPKTGVGLVKELTDCCNNYGFWEYESHPGGSPRAKNRAPQKWDDVDRVVCYRSIAFIWKK